MAGKSALVLLDFDGVICDSIGECLVTAWNGFIAVGGSNGKPVARPDQVDAGKREFFQAHRWMVAPPEHYFVLLASHRDGRPLPDAAAFESAVAAYAAELPEFRRAFFAERSRYKTEARAAWLGLHRVYPHVAARMDAVAAGNPTVIVTTKDEQSVEDVLISAGLEVPRIEGANRLGATGSKAAIVRHLLTELGADAGSTVFLDDHGGHLAGVATTGVRCRLARWGYIDPGPAGQFPGYDTFEAFVLGEGLG